MKADAPWVAIAAVCLAILGMHFVQEFMMPPNMASPFNGTPWAPHSDALGPWLHGGLAYLFGVTPPSYLYRPSVGMIWGSILAVSGRIEMIPFFFASWLGVACAVVVAFAADRALRATLVIVLAYAAMLFPQTWQWIRFDLDLASLALTLSGVLLVLWDRGKGARAALVAGCACLGVVAAIRGPFMLAGPVVIAIRVLVMERPSKRAIVPALVFLAPIAIDLLLQAREGITSNAWLGLFCVYRDPSHGFTPGCRTTYRALLPPNSEVLQGFLAFRFSPEGLAHMGKELASRAGRDLALMCSPAMLALILGVSALASGRAGMQSSPITPFVRALIVVATLTVVSRSASWASGALTWIVLAATAAALTRNWRALLCLAGYLAALLFLAMIGLVFERLVNTFGFMLVLGAGFLIMEGLREASAPSTEASGFARRWLAVSTGVVLVFLYAGSFVVKGQMRETYLREVEARGDRAMKISDEVRVDRSLYYNGRHELVYTRHDELPIGAVRRYRTLATSSIGNQSFISPNAFLD